MLIECVGVAETMIQLFHAFNAESRVTGSHFGTVPVQSSKRFGSVILDGLFLY